MAEMTTAERLKRKLIIEMGPAVKAALADPDVTEIQLNPDGALWTDGRGGRQKVGTMSDNDAHQVATTFATCLRTLVDYENPMIEGQLALLNGERLTCLIPPVVKSTIFALRKHTSSRMTLVDWQESGGLDESQAAMLRNMLKDRRNIIVSGGTGTGKTTFTNALLAELSEISPNHRIVVIEDTPELQVDMPNVVSMNTSDNVGMDQLLRKALRLTPDRIIVGEVRSAEALTMMESWNTGHPGGVSTVHASSAEKARTRLEQMCAGAPNRSDRLIQAAYEASIDVIVQLERLRDGRRLVTEIVVRD